MSNMEIIAGEAMLKGFEYTGENLYTFQEWKKRGYTVEKGQKAFITTSIWRKVESKDKETGKKESKMILVKASLFNDKQVKKLS